jgi:alkanesulfonate monooxygenase SsuD/methylene tetrahydromethanopterin reductase-like flavin-dependent oxidoreductase (luciferase family)
MSAPVSSVRPKIGLYLPLWESPASRNTAALRWTEIRAMARAAEDASFDSIWLPDEVLLSENFLYDGAPAAGVWEGWSMLSAIAATTRRVDLGHLVIANTFRNPALLAKMAETVDEISGGRLVLGLGSGGDNAGQRAFGNPWERRVARFEEAVQIIVPLLREGRVDFAGEFYTVRECELRPRGPRPAGPPILIASLANGPRMMRLTAQYADRWHGLLAFGRSAADEVPPLRAALDAVCATVGRDPATLTRTVSVEVSFPELDSRVTVFGQPIRGSTEEIASAFWAFADEGISHLMLVLSPATLAPIEALGRVIELMNRGR